MRKRDDAEVHVLRADPHRVTDIPAVSEQMGLADPHSSRRARGAGRYFQQVRPGSGPLDRRQIETSDPVGLYQALGLDYPQDSLELSRLHLRHDRYDNERSVPAR